MTDDSLSIGEPYNRPQLCANATWNSDAITFANSSVLQAAARGIYIDTDDTVYFARDQHGDILRWTRGTNISSPDRIITGSLFKYTIPFVSLDKDVYFELKTSPGQIRRTAANVTTSVSVAQFGAPCYGLFIDMNSTLYCSMASIDLISSVSLSRNGSVAITRAGNGTSGSAANQLYIPWGIFVDFNLDLYVADGRNNRIQRFAANQLNGTTVAGQGVPNSLHLAFPTDVILDNNSYLYIADNQNDRIVRVSSTGYHCLIGCSGGPGSASNQLSRAYSLRFDSYGNLYVADEFNSRIQKFLLSSNCEGG